MNRKLTSFYVTLIAILFSSVTAFSQIDSTTNDIISLNNRIFNDPADTLIEPKLVALALTSPRYKSTFSQLKINELDLKRTKSSWLNFFTISMSYNVQSFTKTDPAAPIVYPQSYFTLGIPLGIIFSQGKQVKISKEAVILGKNNQEDLARSISSEILAKYKQYKVLGALMEIQSEMGNDVSVVAAQAEANFKKGAITVETYLNTMRTANEELSRNVNMKLQQELLKLQIEEIIGVPLESVLNPPPPTAITAPKTTK